ncbi:MAG: hypothetical protein HKN39_03095 [Flavobacteriales bacterium]|nr:hypothetical protein [Flavobacteriales bacterium]
MGYCYGMAIAFLYYFIKEQGIDSLGVSILGIVIGSICLALIFKVIHRVFWRRKYELKKSKLNTLDEISII